MYVGLQDVNTYWNLCFLLPLALCPVLRNFFMKGGPRMLLAFSSLILSISWCHSLSFFLSSYVDFHISLYSNRILFSILILESTNPKQFQEFVNAIFRSLFLKYLKYVFLQNLAMPEKKYFNCSFGG